VKELATEKARVAADKASDAGASIKDSAIHAKDVVAEKTGDAAHSTMDAMVAAKDFVAQKASDAVNAAKDLVGSKSTEVEGELGGLDREGVTQGDLDRSKNFSDVKEEKLEGESLQGQRHLSHEGLTERTTREGHEQSRLEVWRSPLEKDKGKIDLREGSTVTQGRDLGKDEKLSTGLSSASLAPPKGDLNPSQIRMTNAQANVGQSGVDVKAGSKMAPAA
jgi:hypothetical protein